MAVFKVQAPDGTIIKVEAADQATAIRGAQEHYASRAKPSTGKDIAKSVATGAVKGVVGIAQMAEMATPQGMAKTVMGKFGQPSGSDQATNLMDRYGHKPETRAGRYSESIAENAVNMLAPGGWARKGVSVALPGVAGEGVRETAEAMGGNELVQAGAKFVGTLAGGLASSMRGVRPLPARTPVSVLPRQDVNALAQRAADYRSSGIQPTLVDVVDDSARGTIRAAASRQTPARQRTTDFQDARALDLPSRMGGQARRVVSQDPRTPDQIRGEAVAARGARADQQFGAVRNQEVQLAPEGVEALRSDYGRAAIREAARRERDPETRAALNRLAEAALDAPATPITVGMADRVSRVLLGQAEEAGRRGDRDLAATLGGLGRSVRSPTAQASPGYRQALDDYGADTRLAQAADVGENLLARNTDEFAEQAGNLTPEERALAQAAARRAIERKAGESTGSAPGVARQIANAPEQQARNRALLGPARATQLQDGMRLEESLVRNANDVAPRFGTQTQNKLQDAASAMGGAARTVVNAKTGNFWGIAQDWLKSRGMNDAQAEELLTMALDPAQTDRAIALIAQRFGPQARQEFISWRNAALLGASAGASAARPQGSEQNRP